MRQRLTALPGGSETRSAIGSTTSSAGAVPHQRGPTPLHIVRRWDTDARVAAWEQAQDAAARDPDAAAYLLDCLSADVPAQDVATDAIDMDDDADADDGAGDGNDDEQSRSPDATVSRTPSAKPFDPMRLLARAAKFYRWSHHDMMKTPWRTFLGYVREADIMTQEEQAQLDAETARGRRRYSSTGGSDGADVFASVPRARR